MCLTLTTDKGLESHVAIESLKLINFKYVYKNVTGDSLPKLNTPSSYSETQTLLPLRSVWKKRVSTTTQDNDNRPILGKSHRQPQKDLASPVSPLRST